MTNWVQIYTPVNGSVGLSAVIAALPILVLLVLLGIFRKPAWMATLSALAVALVIAVVVYGMPARLAITATLFGAAYGVFPIAWVVFASIMLYRITVETGNFEIIKASVRGLTADRRLQAMFIAFCLGAFMEGAAGFGAPVAVCGAMLAGLGFDPFTAAVLCLVANTAPVAFGSIGIPVTTLANITALPVTALSAMVGRLSAMISLLIPAYLMVVMVGATAAVEVLPAIVACGVSFAGMQFYLSNYVGPELTDIGSSLTCIVVMTLLLKVWKPRTMTVGEGQPTESLGRTQRSVLEVATAWSPYALLVIFVLVWGHSDVKLQFNRWTDHLLSTFIPALQAVTIKTPAQLNRIPVPGLHNLITQLPPVTARPTPYAALYEFNWLTASGTACLMATLATGLLLRVRPNRLVQTYIATFKQLKAAILTVASMLALAYLMNYAGMTSTLGLSLAKTGAAFPFFSAVLGWLGVFLTGSDTASNALFGNLQVVTANALGLNPILTASVNSAAGVMGKMISVQSIAVAVATTGMSRGDESRLFRFTLKHSVALMLVVGILSMLFAYVFTTGVPTS